MPAAPDSVAGDTKARMFPLWMSNLASNLERIRNGNSLDNFPKRKEPCIIVGAGPSVKKLKHLDMIKKEWKHPILVCDRMLGDCLAKGLMPSAVGSVDGTDKITGFYTKPIVQKYGKCVPAILGCCTHPKVVEVLHDWDIWWYVPMLDAPVTQEGKINFDSQTYMLQVLTQKTAISGIGNVGAFLWNVALALECDPIILVGFDFSEQVRDKAKGVYFPIFTAMYYQKFKDEKKASDEAADLYQFEFNPDFIATVSDGDYFFKIGKNPRYLVNPVWKLYRKAFASYIKMGKRLTINATGNGCLHTQAKENDDKGNPVYILQTPYFKAQDLSEVIREYGS
jgi:hypothetical protein